MSPWLNSFGRLVGARLRTFVKPVGVFVAGTSAEDAVRHFEEWAQLHPGVFCQMGLSASLVQTCVVPAEVSQDQSHGQQAWLDYARVQFEHYFGLAGDSWCLVSTRDQRAALVCALSTSLLSEIQQVAMRYQIRLRQMLPWWAPGVQALLSQAWSAQPGRVIAAVEPGTVTLVVVQAGRIQRVFTDSSMSPQDWLRRLSVEAHQWPLDCFELGSPQQIGAVLRGYVQAVGDDQP